MLQKVAGAKEAGSMCNLPNNGWSMVMAANATADRLRPPTLAVTYGVHWLSVSVVRPRNGPHSSFSPSVRSHRHSRGVHCTGRKKEGRKEGRKVRYPIKVSPLLRPICRFRSPSVPFPLSALLPLLRPSVVYSISFCTLLSSLKGQ